jgi:uncharacterized membrane protein
MSRGAWKLAILAFVVLAGAVVIHIAAIVGYPYLLMSAFHRKLVERDGKNVLVHFPRDASQRIVRMPSPDLLYSGVAFDLSDGPLRITVPVSEAYTSLSGFASNSDNFFCINDLAAKDGVIDIVLVGPGSPDPGIAGPRLVRSPTKTGLIGVRYFLGKGDCLPDVETLRRRATCETCD